MIFIPLLILGIIFYFSDRRVYSALIFFFFFCDGFQLIPISLFDTGLGISKSMDFAVLYVLILFVIGVCRYRDFIPRNKLSLSIALFFVFILICIAINRIVLGVAWSDIIRTSRYFFFVLGYFVFCRLQRDELLRVMHILFYITTFLCVLYILQGVTGISLLTGDKPKSANSGEISRFYNIPLLYYYYYFYALFSNPIKSKLKFVIIAIYILVIIVSLHRGFLFAFAVLSFLGIYISQGGFKGVVRYILVGCIIILPFVDIMISRFEKKTMQDIDNVVQGAFVEYGADSNNFIDGTFMFRMALFYERYMYVSESTLMSLTGVGYMTEDSRIAHNQFNFVIGLKDDVTDEIIQLDTSDIAWVNFMLRLGIIGTFLFLGIYAVLCVYFFKRRHDEKMLVPLLFVLLLLIVSFVSSLLFCTYLILLPMIDYISQQQKEDDSVLN